MLWVTLDEGVLHRCVGSAEVMREQLARLAEMATRPRVTIQVVPARVSVVRRVRHRVGLRPRLYRSPQIQG